MTNFNIGHSSEYILSKCYPATRKLFFPGASAKVTRMSKNKTKSVVIPRPDINAIEADIAYFGARLSFARRGEDTVYKQAQRRAYQALSDSLAETLAKLQK